MFFRFHAWLLLAGLLAVAAIHWLLAQSLGATLTQRYVERDALVAQEFLEGILAAEGTAAELFQTPAPSPALVGFAANVRSLPGIVRANVYSPDGFIRHSTDPNLVGLQFRDNGELAEALRGRLVATLEAMAESTKEEHLALNQVEGTKLIEAYIPVTAGGTVAAVVEFYRKDEVIADTMATMRRLVGYGAAASMALFAFLLFLARRWR
jgi:hypothetical protein